ncbi:pyridoxamine 5'-phosphate oxidase family protein [Streptomyces sp. NBC_00237]|uniref:pyridoxamine 5'-phosphate oxidase family protein n=1 Tax=Streptomyces sp. NBC_00237 TaxID=2975687 RepID=UPI00225677E6|nr:pyridoxamine 5'-phosphate oxidase family protein [Streptomyces sp. NBC_00237]MCX5200786.1 pyridoxamine 5'-phosphate oxidase family protein [Streptomyces sp. NBC_00237]
MTETKDTTAREPVRTELCTDFSEEAAVAAPWSRAVEILASSELFWISTVRRDGRPHVTPIPAVWRDDRLHFCTGPGEQKAKNLEANPNLVLTTGNNRWAEGFDLVVEGTARRITDDGRLRVLAGAWLEKYGSDWAFEVADGHFGHGEGRAVVFEVEPRKVLGFGKGTPFSQTRWAF